MRYSLENPLAYEQANLAGHLNVLELARHLDGLEALTYASSSSVYAGNAEVPFAEADRVDRPISLYWQQPAGGGEPWLIEEATGRQAKRSDLPRPPGDVERTFADIGLIARDHRFQPKAPLEDGIPRFVEWYLQWRAGRRGGMSRPGCRSRLALGLRKC